MKRSLLLSFLGILFSLFSYSQFTLDAELRPRAEVSRGYGMLPAGEVSDPGVYISQRTRLTAGFARDRFDMAVSLQDVRYWGDDDIISPTGTFGNTGSLVLHEAWFAIRLADGLYLKAGRQGLVYDDQRLLSGRNWNQSGFTYDALKIAYEKEGWKVDAAGTWNNDRAVLLGQMFTPEKMKTLQMLHLTRKLNSVSRLTALVMGVGYTAVEAPTIIFMKGTSGLNFYFERPFWNMHIAGYYQFGKHRDGKEVSAYLFSGNISLKPSVFTFTAGFDYLSGNDASSDDPLQKEQLFDLFYGGRHKFYGFMDYFNNMRAATAGGGLTDLFLKMNVRFDTRHNLQLWYHYFALSRDIPAMISDPGLSSRYLASELDLVYTCTMNDFFKVDLGASTLFDTDLMRAIQVPDDAGADLAHPWWVYLMVTFNPSIVDF